MISTKQTRDRVIFVNNMKILTIFFRNLFEYIFLEFLFFISKVPPRQHLSFVYSIFNFQIFIIKGQKITSQINCQSLENIKSTLYCTYASNCHSILNLYYSLCSIQLSSFSSSHYIRFIFVLCLYIDGEVVNQ